MGELETAEPGDLLKVEILDLGALETWGFTGTFHKDNGGGFLTDHYPEATKACWDFEGVYCKSRHIPGVRFAGLIHPGLIGTAPSAELLKMWNEREAALGLRDGRNTITFTVHSALQGTQLVSSTVWQFGRATRQAMATMQQRVRTACLSLCDERPAVSVARVRLLLEGGHMPLRAALRLRGPWYEYIRARREHEEFHAQDGRSRVEVARAAHTALTLFGVTPPA